MNRLADVTFSTLLGVPVAHITGDVDASNAPRLQRIVLNHVENSDTSLVVDLTPTTYIDSAGIRFLYEISLRLGYRGQALRVSLPANSPVRRVLAITKLDTLIQVDDTPQDAAAILTPPPPVD
jgi:anti-anti-sigma factor